MVDLIKKYWILIAVIGFLLTFSVRLQAMWNQPEKSDNRWQKSQEQFQQLYQSQQDYYTQQQISQERWDNRWQQQERVNQQYYEWLRSINE